MPSTLPPLGRKLAEEAHETSVHGRGRHKCGKGLLANIARPAADGKGQSQTQDPKDIVHDLHAAEGAR